MEHLNKTQLDEPNVDGCGGKQTLKLANIFRTLQGSCFLGQRNGCDSTY